MAEPPLADDEVASFREWSTNRVDRRWLATLVARDAEITRLRTGIAEALTDLPSAGHASDGNRVRARCLLDALPWPCDIEQTRLTLTRLLKSDA